MLLSTHRRFWGEPDIKSRLDTAIISPYAYSLPATDGPSVGVP